MIKERIHVKNVGALKDTGVVELKPLTVLIGNSASGKSTLMKLAVLMRYIFKRICIRAYLKNAQIDEKIFYIRYRDFLRDDRYCLPERGMGVGDAKCYPYTG